VTLDPRLAAAVTACRLSANSIRRLGRGGGTAIPGIVANVIDPGTLDKLSRQVPAGCLVVGGTNGKTTTARMLARILTGAGLRVIHNRTGSNLERGISAAFAGQSSVMGRPAGDIAVVEADEAALPEVVRRIAPRLVILLNLFRDQLDRYGELDTITNRWREAIRKLSADQTVLINADDPSLVALSRETRARLCTFGLDDPQYVLDELPHAADSATCPLCGTALRYDRLYLSHLGEYHCQQCGFGRPMLDFAGHDVVLHGLNASGVTIEMPEGSETVFVGVPGLYNVYNALAAGAAGSVLGLQAQTVSDGLRTFHSAFGRVEQIEYRGRRLIMVLIKNPVGFNEVLRMLALTEQTDPALIVINDLDADGRDVSWLWDADVELLAGLPIQVATAGTRGADMAVRLKYSGICSDRITPLGDLKNALETFVQSFPLGAQGIILPTYTAMLELRRILANQGVVSAFWQQ
jgi:UDP-N-acetylmuramyl tripeptide synthase